MPNWQNWVNEIALADLPEACQDIAEVIGVNNFLALAKQYPGESIYLPKPDSFLKVARDRKIRNEFNGSNYRELAQKYNLTISWVRKIITNDEGR